MSKKFNIIVPFLIIVVISSVGAIFVWINRESSPIPVSIQKQANFALFYPNTTKIKVLSGSLNYDSSINSLRYQTSFLGADQIVNQQAASFTSDKLKGGNGKSFDVPNGRIYITNEDNSQRVVAITEGTLILIQSSEILTDDNWREYFQSLDAD